MTEIVGLDIGSTTLRAVQIKKRTLLAFAYAPAPAGITIASEDKEDLTKLAEAIANLFRSGNFSSRNVVVSLLEPEIFTRVIAFPRMEEKEITAAVQNEAQQYIPLPLEETTLDYEILGPSEVESGKIDVLLVAAPKVLTQRYVTVLNQAGLNPLSLETEAMALSRSGIGGDTGKASTMITSIGAKTTDLSIFSGNALRFTRSISTGGEALIRSLSQNLGFEMEQAREYFKSYGLLEDLKTGGKVMTAIKPIFDIIVEEIRRSLTFYSSRHKKQVKRLVLIGGVTNLPGIVVYLAEVLGIEVGRGDPWETVTIPDEFPRKELTELAPTFAVAVGLALKEL